MVAQHKKVVVIIMCYITVQVQNAKLHMAVPALFSNRLKKIQTSATFFLQFSTFISNPVCLSLVYLFLLSLCYSASLISNHPSASIDQTSLSGVSFTFCLQGDVLTFKAAACRINNLHSDSAAPLNIQQNITTANVHEASML